MIKNYYKKIITIAIIAFFAFMVIWLYFADFGQNSQIEFGINFSQKYASELQMDWKEVLTSFLDELNVKKFRVAAYWDLLEPGPGLYDFSDLDWQINSIAERGGKVILAFGSRVPRWPECHWPSWIYQNSVQERNQKILNLLKNVVEHYKGNPAIEAWQVENEPFLRFFGQCPPLDENFYAQELALVKSLDNRPIVVTESGELSTWLNGARSGDLLGISVYRITWNKFFGYFYYPLPPAHYYLKAKIVKLLTGNKNIFISEMQSEPWLGMPILQTSIDYQAKTMNLEKFKKNIQYIKRAGISPVYLWGAEWWYWMKKQNDGGIWYEAKELFKSAN